MIKRLVSCISLVLFLVTVPGASSAVHAETRHPESSSPRPLVIAVTVDPPYSMKDSEGKWTGLVVELWSLVARDLGHPFVFREMTFEKVFRALDDRSIDLSIATVYVTAEREAKYDLTTPLGTSRFAVATLHGAKDHPWWEAVRVFLSWSTLKIFFGMSAVLLFLGWLFWFIERKRNPEYFGEGLLQGIGAGIYWVGSTLTSGTCFGVSLKTSAGRILGLVWMAVCTLALSAFIASLTAVLSEQRLESRRLTPKELQKMHLGTEKGTLEAAILKEQGGRYTLFASEESFMQALRERKIDGIMSDEITLHYFKEQRYRDAISVYPTGLKRHAFALAMPKNSPLRRPVNVALAKIMDDPLWDTLLDRYGFEKNIEARSSVTVRRGKYVSKEPE